MKTNKIETWIGIGLLIIVIVVFVFELFAARPAQSTVTSRAQTIPVIPRDLFSATNPLNKKVSQLNVPSNVPVAVTGGEIGRDNVFANF